MNKPAENILTLQQQRKALRLLKAILKEADEANPGLGGFDDHADSMEIRLFLIAAGEIPDRRAAWKRPK